MGGDRGKHCSSFVVHVTYFLGHVFELTPQRDAGIVLSCHLNEPANVTDMNTPLEKMLEKRPGKERLGVLELGTGCGLVSEVV